MAKKKADSEDKGYKAELDAILGEVELDEKHVLQVRQYNGGATKVGVFFRGKKGVYATNRYPVSIAKKLGAAIESLEGAGLLGTGEETPTTDTSSEENF